MAERRRKGVCNGGRAEESQVLPHNSPVYSCPGFLVSGGGLEAWMGLGVVGVFRFQRGQFGYELILRREEIWCWVRLAGSVQLVG